MCPVLPSFVLQLLIDEVDNDEVYIGGRIMHVVRCRDVACHADLDDEFVVVDDEKLKHLVPVWIQLGVRL